MIAPGGDTQEGGQRPRSYHEETRFTMDDLLEISGATNSHLTAELIVSYCALVAEGHPFDAVNDYLGISASTYWEWMKKGEAYLKNAGEPKDQAIYGLFYRACRRAFGMYRLAMVRDLHSSDNAYWFRQLKILERRDRRSFGVTDPAGGTIEEFDPNDRFL